MLSKQCTHIFRSAPLHPSIRIGGGIKLGRCTNECFPKPVVCYEHATKEALALLARRALDKVEDSP